MPGHRSEEFLVMGQWKYPKRARSTSGTVDFESGMGRTVSRTAAGRTPWPQAQSWTHPGVGRGEGVEVLGGAAGKGKEQGSWSRSMDCY